MSAEISAEWRVPPGHPALAGHFPGRPIVPGVVLLDRSLLLAGSLPPGRRWCIAQAKFLRPVGPGEVLRWSFTATSDTAQRFAIHAGDALVASGLLQQEAV
ncbi:MAG: beta-hydroxyacyl-ACP dehydratase [Proteobacteria bacterium]|nr:beta-hydroxyacyl-ACP dehydratase [Pseudomonadota bacterium]MBS0494018.1 beta-hydroxyacyl-ACP dehydratase [Pseudomonadota bacterium]